MICNTSRFAAASALIVSCYAGAAHAAKPLCDGWGAIGAAGTPVVGDATLANPAGDSSAASQPHAANEPAQVSSSASDDPLQVFLSVVNRYRRLYTYRDTVNLVQVTRRVGEEPTRIETRLVCEVTAGELRVTTPASQVKSAVGLNMPAQQSDDAKQRERDYARWLAPHMSLKYAEKPLEEFRAGVNEGFTATKVQHSTVDDKTTMHVELRSGDGLSESCTAEFDLYIDSQSMLIERIEGRQRLPDGAELETTLKIDPDESIVEDMPQGMDPVS